MTKLQALRKKEANVASNKDRKKGWTNTEKETK